MADFSELVRIKKRLCIKHKSSGCIECPINGRMGNLCGIISISGYSDNKFMELEEALLSWAAEHPEPVYETWGQYFRRYYGLEYCKGHKMLLENIPADIAEKLGIEPKEG